MAIAICIVTYLKFLTTDVACRTDAQVLNLDVAMSGQDGMELLQNWDGPNVPGLAAADESLPGRVPILPTGMPPKKKDKKTPKEEPCCQLCFARCGS